MPIAIGTVCLPPDSYRDQPRELIDIVNW